MADQAGRSERVFKTAWFAKASRKASITAAELCAAMRQVMLGQADDLGGGVYKKRLGKNPYRSILVARGGRYWVYEYLFAKQDRDNIEEDDLIRSRKIAKAYETLTEQQADQMKNQGWWMEICNDR